MLNEVSQNKINTTRIEKNWGEILRVAGSLKSGKVNATELTKFSARMFQKNISEEKKRKTRNVDLTAFLVFFMSHYRYFLYRCSSDPLYWG